MSGKFKIVGQVGLGLIVGVTMMCSSDIVIRQNHEILNETSQEVEEVVYETENVKATQTTIPFVKENNFDYTYFTKWMGEHAQTGGWILFILVAIFIVTATSNGANLTDGLDGLAAGCSAIIAVALAIMAYLGGSIVYSSYLNIMYIPGSEELAVFCSAFIGALIGFLWYNAFPAQVFMGDTGSLTLGGIIAVLAILTHKEILLPLLCAIFYVEDLSVMMQVAYFKFTKRKYGVGRRIFKMTPLHHHFQKPGNSGIEAILQKPIQAIPESKIVVRFWIICIFLAVITFVTLKIR
jgi:phospho-N-acetylmuramoyl-pentapeptide-transferase